MNKTSVAALAAGAFFASIFSAETAAAQTMGWVPGAEIRGHPVRVNVDGVTNTIYFEPGGTARIVSEGGREVRGTWFVENQMLCLQTGAARECWPYRTPFQAGQPVTLTSTCGLRSQWVALSTEQPMVPPPVSPPMQERAGERG